MIPILVLVMLLLLAKSVAVLMMHLTRSTFLCVQNTYTMFCTITHAFVLLTKQVCIA